VFDERSAAFFALGLARRTRRPVALVCTSGTAGANYLPALIEAEASGVPLIVLTADRPPEMRDCASGQTIDQQKLFGKYAVWEHELALPDVEQLRYLRQTIAYAFRRSLTPLRGPVHLNVPFRDPLAPVETEGHFLPRDFRLEPFLQKLSPPQVSGTVAQLDDLEEHSKGLIVAGYTLTGDREAYAEAVIAMANQLGWPVLADVLSPVRTYAPKEAPVITHYDILLRDEAWAARHRPDFVLQFGDLPTSKVLRNWLRDAEAETLVIDSTYRNLDPVHARSTHLRLGDDAYAEPLDNDHATLSGFARDWIKAEQEQRERIQKSIRELDQMFEGKVAYLLSRKLPNGTPVFLASSMPVRDAESFWMPSERGYAIHANRGANGIDGTLSSALGIAHGRRSAVLLTGDLAFLHDSNGLLIAPKLRGSLTVILINNGGGRIFENLPIAAFEPPFEEYFATPQQVDFGQLCAAHGVEHQLVDDWPSFVRLISDLPRQGMRVLEIRTDAKRDVPLRRRLLGVTPASEERSDPASQEQSPRRDERKKSSRKRGRKNKEARAEFETPSAQKDVSDKPSASARGDDVLHDDARQVESAIPEPEPLPELASESVTSKPSPQVDESRSDEIAQQEAISEKPAPKKKAAKKKAAKKVAAKKSQPRKQAKKKSARKQAKKPEDKPEAQ